MHEWALADAVVSSAKKIAKEKDIKKIDEVTVVLGDLQNVNVEAFTFLFKEIISKEEDIVKEANIVIENEPPTFECTSCENVFTHEDTKKLTHDESETIHFVPELAKLFIKCPKCESPDFKVIKGRGVYLKNISGER
jgi:hydrogenase nickel incorporation protein HypA/HybF